MTTVYQDGTTKNIVMKLTSYSNAVSFEGNHSLSFLLKQAAYEIERKYNQLNDAERQIEWLRIQLENTELEYREYKKRAVHEIEMLSEHLKKDEGTK